MAMFYVQIGGSLVLTHISEDIMAMFYMQIGGSSFFLGQVVIKMFQDVSGILLCFQLQILKKRSKIGIVKTKTYIYFINHFFLVTQHSPENDCEPTVLGDLMIFSL